MKHLDHPVYFIGNGQSDSQDLSPAEVGAKAYNLMRMDAAGLPVPPAFVLGTDFCRAFFADPEHLLEQLPELLAANMRRLENACSGSFGGRRRPLLVSVRSGAPVSMPGMMESILNVGLNDATVHGLIRQSGNPRLGWDSYRRLVESYANVVHGLSPAGFEHLAREFVDPDLFPDVSDLDAPALRQLTADCLQHMREESGHAFPQDPMDQLCAAVAAVFRSWRSPKAEEYRRLNGIDGDIGTAVTVQVMVFGNAGGTSGSGVGFTRDPATGKDELYIDFLFNAQGEDVVAGRRPVTDTLRLPGVMPEVHARLVAMKPLLEAEFGDMQDFEFTVEDGELYMLQTRTAKRTPWAALHVAVDLVEQGLIEPAVALARLAYLDADSLQRVSVVAESGAAALARAIPASIGVAVGEIALDEARARAVAEAGRPVILVREAIATEDIGALAVAEGILTATGGRTSHAAVVARQMGKVCLVGCDELRIDLDARCCEIGGRALREGETLSLDGNGGAVHAGRLEVRRNSPTRALERVAAWRGAGKCCAGER